MNAVFDHDTPDFYHHYQLVHEKYTNRVIEGLQLVFIELPKFKPQTITEKKMQVLWLRFLTEINDETREVPIELLENAEVSEALEIVERAVFSDVEMRAYDKFWDIISTRTTEMNAVKREAEKAFAAMAEAEKIKVEADKVKAEVEDADARTKAKLKQKDIETARKLKAIGMPSKQIAEITSLAFEQIETL